MNHCTDEVLQDYILDQRSLTEAERMELEEHIYTCGLCLENYMKWIEVHKKQLPVPADGTDFSDKILSQLPIQKKTPATKKTQYLKPLLHYGIAASITLLLMASGVFQGLTGIVSTIHDAPKQEETSISENVMNRALLWINFQEQKLKEGKH